MKPALFVTLFGRSLLQRVIATFSAGEQGVIYDPSDISTLFQDAAGTVPVTASGQPVRLMRDKSGRGNHATAPSDAARPIYTESNGLKYLVSDGANTAMSTAAIDLTGTNQITLVSGLRKTNDATTAFVFEFGTNSTAANGAFYVAAPASNGASKFQASSRGTAASVPLTTSTAFNAPVSAVVSFYASISAPFAALSLNGAAPTGTLLNTDTQGTGNYGNAKLYLFARNDGASLRFTGNFYGMVVNARSTGISAAERMIMERWLNQNTRITLA